MWWPAKAKQSEPLDKPALAVRDETIRLLEDKGFKLERGQALDRALGLGIYRLIERSSKGDKKAERQLDRLFTDARFGARLIIRAAAAEMRSEAKRLEACLK
ncbi:MAG: hypothetical protein KGL39_34965 [Patescibacteria group bacterium]|nr:hypothetical protein [Patescibacteria group bacterium]